MAAAHFGLGPQLDRPCWHCRHFLGFVAQGVHATCVTKHGRHVQADPRHGCYLFEREPGIDDEPGPAEFRRTGE